MPDIITLTCPKCDGKLEITEDIDRFSCAHCGAEHVVKRGGGIVTLMPVLENVSKSVDNTASELALVRLDKEIAVVRKRLSQIESQTTRYENARSIASFGALWVAGVILLWIYSDFGAGSLILIIPGVFMLFRLTTAKPLLEEKTLLTKKLKELKAERERHYSTDQSNPKDQRIAEIEKRVDEEEKEKSRKVKIAAIVLELLIGIFGVYGIGHLISKRWVSGILLFLFSFFWLIVEGFTKDVILMGNYPMGFCALAFHAPIVLVSILLLRKEISE